jgi:transcriptional regulator with XRE-family HTH domain
MDTGYPGPPEGQFAARLNLLFDAVRRPDGKQYSPQQVADAINEAAGHKFISGTYIWQLRDKRRDNPTFRHIMALSLFFGVPASYFFEQEGQTQEALPAEVSAALQNDKIREITLRTIGMSERSLETISGMIDSVRALDPPRPARKRARKTASRSEDQDSGQPED